MKFSYIAVWEYFDESKSHDLQIAESRKQKQKALRDLDEKIEAFLEAKELEVYSSSKDSSELIFNLKPHSSEIHFSRIVTKSKPL